MTRTPFGGKSMFGGVGPSPQTRPGRRLRELAHSARHPLARQLSALCAFLMSLHVATAASAADRIRIAAQKTGTLAWELDVIRAHGLDKQADLDIQVVELASTEAGRIALVSGSADMIVSDWLWVARERSLGANLVYYPYSSTLGAVMAPAT